MRRFRVCTLANDLAQYGQLRQSLARAGFTDDRCAYELFDNSSSGRYDPYQVISDVLTRAEEPYAVFCHQDVRADRGDGYERLLDALCDLDRLDARWAVAGNAGATADLTLALRITDPHVHDACTLPLPRRVVTLDENFLVVRTSSRLACTRGLSGFHLYGADLCLNAQAQGRTCYVIDFHLTHLSGGRMGVEFAAGVRAFEGHWRRQAAFRYVATTSTCLFLSRHAPLRATFGHPGVVMWVKHHPGPYAVLRRVLPGLTALRRAPAGIQAAACEGTDA